MASRSASWLAPSLFLCLCPLRSDNDYGHRQMGTPIASA
jgi:hypothetical protein